MRKFVFALAVGAVCVTETSAQIKTNIREETRNLSTGSGNALVMELPATKKKDVEAAWEDFVKQYKGKTKFDKKTGEFLSDECTIKDMSKDKVDIIVKVGELTTGTELTAWFDLGASTYLSSKDKPQMYPVGDRILKEFAETLSATMIEEQLKAEEKKLKEFEEELLKLEKTKTSRDKDISDYRETIKKQEDNIRKAEDDIKANLTSQDDKKKQINDQKKVVEEVQGKLKQTGKKK